MQKNLHLTKKMKSKIQMMNSSEKQINKNEKK